MSLDPNSLEPLDAPDFEGAADAPATTSALADDDKTGLPGLQTWQQVYVFVGIVFVIYVVLLTVLSGAFA